jgi:hypothetical protein
VDYLVGVWIKFRVIRKHEFGARGVCLTGQRIGAVVVIGYNLLYGSRIRGRVLGRIIRYH